MTHILRKTILVIVMTFSIGVAGQKFNGLDKSPTDITAYPSSNIVSEKLVKVIYGRPNLKGRSLSNIAPEGKVWRTGANEASEITFFDDVKFGTENIKAGTYSLFTIPNKGEWTIILNRNLNQWGAYSYDKSKDVARIKAPVDLANNSLEVFSIAFEDSDIGFKMILGWDKIRVTVNIDDIEFDYQNFLEELNLNDSRAIKLYGTGDKEDKKKALEIWLEMESQIHTAQVKTDEVIGFTASLYRKVANTYNNFGESKNSLLYYSKMIDIAGLPSKKEIVALVSSDRVIEKLNDNQNTFQQEFVLKTKKILQDNTNSTELVNEIESAEQAFEVLEILAYGDKKVQMSLTSKQKGLKVYYRRWANRKNDMAWELVFTDKILNVPRAWYQIKYTVNNSDVIENLPCADGCSFEFK